MQQIEGNAIIAQGGGPTAVINQSLVGAIIESNKQNAIETLYGAIHGVEGIVNENLINLTELSQQRLARLAQTPSSALLSTRDKPDKEYCKKIVEKCKKNNVHYFFYIGGNDTSDALRVMNKYAQEIEYPLTAIHIPKTIDNDLVITDHCPGYGSAARFVAQAFMGLDLDNRSLKGVYIGVVMGRHAGFLTAASALCRKNEDDGPHLIYLPERPFSMDKFIKSIKEKKDQFGRCVVAVSEGIQNKNGEPIAAQLTQDLDKDPHGNVCLSNISLNDLLVAQVQEALPETRVRGDKFGYIQRSFPASISSTDTLEARAVGEFAVREAVAKQISGSVIIQRKISLATDDKSKLNSANNYQSELKLAKLEDIGGKTKTMPDEFINEDGNDVTNAFIRYATPLIGEPLQEIEVLGN